MKPTLDFSLSQQLTMTPQLQQAIRLLQLSTMDLQQEIQQALDNNPLLESDDASHDNGRNHSGKMLVANGLMDLSEAPEQPHNDDDAPERELPEEWLSDTIPDELPVDSVWDDVYQPPSSLTWW